MSKIPVYFMPGMAASKKIFDKIDLPNDTFDVYFLEWVLPKEKETLQQYAKRICSQINHNNIVLIGVSFGGVLVQEMETFITVRKLIIISSIKSNLELPKKMKLAKATKIYKLLPTSLLKDVEKLVKFAFGSQLKKKLILYEMYLHMRNKAYLDWAIEQMICWNRVEVNPNVIHIHGDADTVFPVKNITQFINVKGGTHAMILTKYSWLNTNLPKIILDN